jgi:hypothetical protein
VRLVDVSDAEADAMTLADNAKGLQGTDNPEAVLAMAAQFGRESAAMADMGFTAEALDAMVKGAGDAVLGAGSAPRDGIVAGDAATEWEGMPEFENPSDCHRKVWVSFSTAEDVAAFFAAIGQEDTGSTKSIWYPPKARRDLEGLRWE